MDDNEGLNILIQVYLSHTSKWYSSVITTFIGALGIPLLVFNLQLTLAEKIRELYLHLFSFLTVLFLLATLYFLHKTIYSLQLLEELYRKMLIEDGKRNLIEYRNEIMNILKDKSIIFKQLVKRKQKDQISRKYFNLLFYSSFLIALGGGILLLSLIWIPFNENMERIMIWECIYCIGLLVYLKKKPI